MSPTVEEELLRTLESAILAHERSAECLENAHYWAWMSAKGIQPPKDDPIALKVARMAGRKHADGYLVGE